MDRQPLYFTILFLSILIASSFYLSWSVDRGMGEVTVERLTIEGAPGRSIELLVYSPRTANHYEPMPVMLTIHGLTGSKEGLYAFNVELARRNFTVVSIDLPGHGDSSLEFDITNFSQMAQDAYAALRYVQTTFTNVDNESYGVLTHSLGFRVANELKDFPIAPKAYVAVGDVGKISEGEYVDFPENLLFAMGSFDEIVTQHDALQAIRFATSNESAVAGITYGSLDNQTAYRLSFGPSNHIFEVVDKSLVSEAVSWLIQGVQGEDQLIHTRNPSDQVYNYKNIATILGSFFILVSVIPVMWLTYSFLPANLKPRRIKNDTQSYSLRRTFEISSWLGGGTVLIFNFASIIGLGLEDSGFTWFNSMSSTGLALFFIFGAIGLLFIMILRMGRNNTWLSLSSIGVERLNIKVHAYDILKNLIVASIGITWFMLWLGIAGASKTQPEILLVLIKWPVGIRWSNIVILTVLAIPFLLVEASWIRGILMSEREWSTSHRKTASLLFALFSKFAIVVLLTVISLFATTSAGVSGGRIVLIGVIWVRILIVQVLAAVITAWASFEFENTWSAVIVSAFILSLVILTTVPII